MEAQEDYNQVFIKQMMIKGKRTKRHRTQPHAPVSPPALSIAPPSSSSSGSGRGGGGGGGGELVLFDGVSTSSDDQSVEVISTRTVEEEDMANCLILLAQGGDRRDLHDHSGDRGDGTRNSEPRQVNDVVYQCKTCNRCFRSFQALGGHRASHKKPKTQNMTPEEKKTMSFQVEDRDQFANSASSTTLSLQISSRGILGNENNNNNNNNNNSGANGNNSGNKAKVHECSICGAAFTSGQALGGHMRRHRATSFMAAPTAMAFNEGTTSSSDHGRESKKRKNDLQLDLNLPAPDDDSRGTKFPFSGKEQVIVFAASPLVDCYY